MRRFVPPALLFLLLTAAAGAQAGQWSINSFASLEAAEEALGALPQNAVAVGLAVDPDGVVTLLAVPSSRKVTDAQIVAYPLDDDFSTAITATMQLGWTPMDISRNDEEITVLWAELAIGVDDWRIVDSAVDINSRSATINQYTGEGFTLWGFSAEETRLTYLFLKFRESPTDQYSVAPVARTGATISAAMDEGQSDGWIPTGFDLTEELAWILFAR